MNTSDTSDLRTATLDILDFTTQKNGMRREKIFQCTSSGPLLYTKEPLIRRILCLKEKGAILTSPLRLIRTT